MPADRKARFLSIFSRCQLGKALSESCLHNQDKRGHLLPSLTTGWLVPEAHCKMTIRERSRAKHFVLQNQEVTWSP